MDRRLITNLKEIVDETQCKIVLSRSGGIPLNQMRFLWRIEHDVTFIEHCSSSRPDDQAPMYQQLSKAFKETCQGYPTRASAYGHRLIDMG